jgi:hypothetical protein
MAETKTDTRMAEDKKRLAAEREAREKSRAEHDKKYKGTPTPTQEEADLAALGHHPELAPDGSEDPDKPAAAPQKQAEAGSGASYQTRQATAHKPSQSG